MRANQTVILVFLFCVSRINAQVNLVPNAGFDVLRLSGQAHCGAGLGGIDRGESVGWFTPTSSSDVFSPCTFRSDFQAPLNRLGFQLPHSDSVYAGIGFFRTLLQVTTAREFLGQKLVSPLQKDSVYYASMFVSLADTSDFAISGLQFWLLDSATLAGLSPNRFFYFPGNPQVTNPPGNYIFDKINWVNICGVFVASGTESHLLIGNFTDSIAVPARSVNYPDSIFANGFVGLAYYYIDDVSVRKIPGGLTSRTYRQRFCADELPVSLEGREGFLWYRWSTGDSTRFATIREPGVYWVENGYGCGAVRDTFVVSLEQAFPAPDLGPARFNCEADVVQSVVLDAGYQPNYHWSTGDTTRTVTVTHPGEYIVTVTYDLCAARSDSVVMLGCPPNFDFRLEMPNVFTPNGDGINDRFVPIEIYNLEWERLQIYDRWGREVYKGTDPLTGWDGHFQGQVAAEGVYYYKVNFRRPVTGIPDHKSGVLTLIR